MDYCDFYQNNHYSLSNLVRKKRFFLKTPKISFEDFSDILCVSRILSTIVLHSFASQPSRPPWATMNPVMRHWWLISRLCRSGLEVSDPLEGSNFSSNWWLLHDGRRAIIGLFTAAACSGRRGGPEPLSRRGGGPPKCGCVRCGQRSPCEVRGINHDACKTAVSAARPPTNSSLCASLRVMEVLTRWELVSLWVTGRSLEFFRGFPEEMRFFHRKSDLIRSVGTLSGRLIPI